MKNKQIQGLIVGAVSAIIAVIANHLQLGVIPSAILVGLVVWLTAELVIHFGRNE